tara:strand:- start:38 stop:997 length:960 start_codon:yes stop_codon:yes gene_type:complete
VKITRRQLRDLIIEAISAESDEEYDLQNRKKERRAIEVKLEAMTWSDPSYAATIALHLDDPALLLDFWADWKWISDYIFWESLAVGGSGVSHKPIDFPLRDYTDRVRKMAKWMGARPHKRTGWMRDFKIDVAELGNIRPNLEGVDDVDDDGAWVLAPPPENLEKEIEYIRARDNFISKHGATFNNAMASGPKRMEIRDVSSSGLLDAVLSALKERQGGDDIIEGKKASKSKGKPYKGSRRGKTESQAQQMAAGIALSAREKYGKAGAIKKLKGASKSMAAMSMKDLRKLATIRRGSEVPDNTKKGHERAALPGHIKKKK